MSLDELQQVWQSQQSGRLSVDPQLIVQQIRRNQQSFRAMIFCRDFREVFVGLMLVPVSVYMAYTIDWASLALGAAGLFIAGYILIDRWRHRRRASVAAEPLVASIEESLRDVDHQIWLLRNVFWWYLLPCAIACAIVWASIALTLDLVWGQWLFFFVVGGFCSAVFCWVYWLNQRAVRAELEPRRNELLALYEGIVQSNGDHYSRRLVDDPKKGPSSVLRIMVYLTIAVLAPMFLIGTFRLVQYRRLPDPAAAGGEPRPIAEAELRGARDISDVLEPIRKKYKLPALAAAMLRDGKLVVLGAAGVRRAGGAERVSVHDQFHIGSCTKAMTAMLCAILVEEGKLRWDSTLGEVFADQADKILPAYRNVTLEQLLTHRSGLPEDRQPDRVLWPKVLALTGPLLDQRRALVELVLSSEPAAEPGAKFQYSNMGYALAGAMCERVTNQSWEDLMRERLFKPLDMTTAGFGPPGTAEKIDQPWGHLVRGATWMPIPPGPDADNPAVIGPAGTVHCSLADWAKFAAVYLQTDATQKSLVSADTLRKLQTPLPGEDYAYGWKVTNRGWAGGKALMHAGSNTMWFADVWLAPERDTAYLSATNVGTDNSFLGCDAAISALIRMSDTQPKPKE